MDYGVLSQRVDAFFHEKKKLNKSEMKSKMENAAHPFREAKFMVI